MEKSFKTPHLDDRKDLQDGININKRVTGFEIIKEMYLLLMAIYIVCNVGSQGSSTRQFNSVLQKTEQKMLGAVVAKRERDRFILSARNLLIKNCYRFSHSERILQSDNTDTYFT